MTSERLRPKTQTETELLKCVEHALEANRRLSVVAGSVIDAMRHSRRLSEAVLTDYARQLETVEKQRERLQGTLRLLLETERGSKH